MLIFKNPARCFMEIFALLKCRICRNICINYQRWHIILGCVDGVRDGASEGEIIKLSSNYVRVRFIHYRTKEMCYHHLWIKSDRMNSLAVARNQCRGKTNLKSKPYIAANKRIVEFVKTMILILRYLIYLHFILTMWQRLYSFLLFKLLVSLRKHQLALCNN